MNQIAKCGCRIYQTVMKYAMYVMPWRKPELIEGEDGLKQLAALIAEKHMGKMLVVTDVGIAKIGLHERLLRELEKKEVPYVVYDRTIANPTIANVEEAFSIYRENQCQGIIALGGGSAMDCAKVVGARAARPNMPVSRMKGILKIWKKLPPLFAIPTTSGTGSETTLAAVITDEKTRHKYPINDFMLIPKYAVLDPHLTVGLPADITATTGMDALTHAVEAYIGNSNTKQTKEDCICAVRLVFEHLYTAYKDGSNMEARERMQEAAYLAGAAFTRAYVGNVHALAHALGGAYGVPHGLANAVILPYVLDAYGEKVYKKLAELADVAALGEEGDTDEDKAKKFIQEIRNMNRKMNIPDKIAGMRKKDIPVLAVWASREANPLYPVPVIFGRKQFRALYEQVMDQDRPYGYKK